MKAHTKVDESDMKRTSTTADHQNQSITAANILLPIGVTSNQVTLIQFIEKLGNDVAGDPILSELADVIITGKYVPKERPALPLRIRIQPLEPSPTSDSIRSAEQRAAYANEKEAWDIDNEEYLSNMIIYSELLKSWAKNEDSNTRKMPQVFTKISNHLSKESKDLIERTYSTTFETLNRKRNPVELMKMISETHSNEYTGIIANDQLQAALRLLNASRKPEESPSQFYRRMTQEHQALNLIGGIKISDEVMAVKFASSLGPTYAEFKKEIFNLAIMDTKAFPKSMIEILPMIGKHNQQRTSTSIELPSNLFAINDDVEREGKETGICHYFNTAKGCKWGNKCFKQHVHLPEKQGKSQHGKAKCEACDGNHDKSRCPIMIAGKKNLNASAPAKEVEFSEDIVDTIVQSRWNFYGGVEQPANSGWSKPEEERQIH